MQNMVNHRSAAERQKNAERSESRFLRAAKKAARRNVEAMKELAKH